MKQVRYILIKIIPAALIMLSGSIYSQGISINTDGASPDGNAMLDAASSTKGILIPRIDYNDRPTIGLTSGLLIYVTANGPSGNNVFYYYNGSDWTLLGGGSSEWTDAGTILYPADDLGTTDEIAIGGTDESGADIFLGVDGVAVFNEQGNDADFRIEGDNDANAFFADASADNIGIGTSAPTAKLHVYGMGASKGNVVFVGDYGDGGDPPVTGAGQRMMWYPDKAAFRAGNVTTQWDKANVGNYSFATNNYTTASGSGSFAAGAYTTASGSGSFAAGTYAAASGDYSAAMGDYPTAQAYASLTIGKYNVLSGTTNSWVATDPVFVIGTATTPAARLNAVTVLKNGNVGIGSSAPTQLFAIYEPGTVLDKFLILSTGQVRSTASGTAAAPSYSFTSDPNTGMYWGNASMVYFSTAGTLKMTINRSTNTGNVGIGSATPAAKLDVCDGNVLLTNSTGTAGELRLYESTANGTNYTKIVATAQAADVVLTLPPAYAAVANYILSSTTAGVLSWVVDATVSDMRLKKNIKPLENSLERVMKLNGCSFQYIDTTQYEPGIQMGFIAQQAADIIPEVVKIDPVTGYYYMHYRNLTALLSEAIKEHQKIIENQQNQIKELKSENNNLKAENQKNNQELDNIESILKTVDK